MRSKGYRYTIYGIIVFLSGAIPYIYFDLKSDNTASIYEAGSNSKFVVGGVLIIFVLIEKYMQKRSKRSKHV